MESSAARILLPVEEETKYIFKTHDKYGKLLRKDGLPKRIAINNKKEGVSSEVEALTFEDAKKILKYFYDREEWHHYLAFTFSCNMARRAGDTLKFKWKNLFDPSTGELRKHLLPIKEQKTGKYASPYINEACEEAIKLYIHMTGANPPAYNYEGFVFVQAAGTHVGHVLTLDGHKRALKRAARESGITYKVGTHSGRKTFGKLSRMLHPNDYDSMELLRLMFNHSDVKTTGRYIGLTKERLDKFNDDMGRTWMASVVGNEDLNLPSNAPVITADTRDIRDLLKTAYKLGMDDNEARHQTGEENPTASMDAMDTLMEILENIRK